MLEAITLMRDRFFWKRFAFASGTLCLAGLFFVAIFVYSAIVEVQRKVVPAILAGLADSLSDEQTLREPFISPIFTDAEVEAILSDHGEEFKAALASDDDNVRIGSFILLGEAGPKAVPFVPELIGALDDQNPEVRRHAVYALGELGEDAAPAIDLLRTMSRNEHERVQPEAVKAVEKIAGSNHTIPRSDEQ